MTDTLTTTVIIPTYNRAEYLVETLESVFSQSLAPGEIIVADDGSTDNTPERMSAYSDRVRYLRKENSGKADTLNQCIELAQHPLIWIVDDDDIVLPHALETMTDLIARNPEAGFSYGCYERFSTNEKTGQTKIMDCGHWQDLPTDMFFIATMRDMFVHHPGLLVRKTAYKSVGPFQMDLPRSEDYEMLVRLARQFPGVGTREIVFRQRQHDGLRTGGLRADQRTENWQQEQKLLFRRIHKDSSLADFLPRNTTRSTILSRSEQRQALISRGSIMARKKLWSLACEDYFQASQLLPDQALTPPEVEALRMAVFSKYGCDEIIDDPTVAKQIRSLRDCKPVGVQITATLAKALLWFVRDAVTRGKIGRAFHFGRIILTLSTDQGERRTESVRTQ